MARVDRREVVLDTSSFTPTQLHTRFLLECGMTGWAAWARANLVPFGDLIREWGVGLVVVGIHAAWRRPFRFFDADVVTVTSAITIRPDGELLSADIGFLANGETVADWQCLMRPIRVTDASLGAEPAAFPPGLLERFQPDELVPPPERERVPARAERIRGEGRPLGQGTHGFRVRRADTEVADQWSFIDLPAFAAAGREELVLSGEHAGLDGALARPLAALDVQISRPLFVFDEARAVTDAYDVGGVLTFVHTIESDAAGGRTHATLIETFGG